MNPPRGIEENLTTEEKEGGNFIVATEHELDLQLARQVLARDRKAIAEFVQNYTDLVHGYVRRRVGGAGEGLEDLVQEVFLAAWKGLAKYQGDSPLAHWLLGIARFKVNDYYRSKLRATLSLDGEEDGWDPPAPELKMEQILDRERAAERAVRILEQLREEYGMLLRWKYWDGRSTREMAEDLGKSEKSVERMLARARGEFESVWAKTKGGRDAGR